MKKLIVVADWASDSLTNQEFRSAVEGFAENPKDVSMSFVSSTPSTIHTAFLLSQLIETEKRYGRPMDTVIFQNTDPRIQATTSSDEAKGAEFVVVLLKSGLYICGPNAGYSLSFLRDQIQAVFTYPGFDKGSQFRSRDLYARISAHLMDAMEDDLELEETHINSIPALEGKYIGHIDNYGNIKTTFTSEDLKGKYDYGDEIEIKINQVTKKVTYVKNLFGGNPGELVLYPGSSGKIEEPFLEISIWRHFTEENPTTGLHAFNLPRPGMEVEVK
jgi:hypothetical protein